MSIIHLYLSILSGLGWLQIRTPTVVEEVNLSAGHNEQSDRKEYGDGVLVGKEVRYKLPCPLRPPRPMGRAQNIVISINVLETSLF